MRSKRCHHLELFQNYCLCSPSHPQQHEEVATGLSLDSHPSLAPATHHRITPMSSSPSPCKSDASQLASNQWNVPLLQSSIVHRTPDTPVSSANHHPYRPATHTASQTIYHQSTCCSHPSNRTLSPHSTNCSRRFDQKLFAPNRTTDSFRQARHFQRQLPPTAASHRLPRRVWTSTVIPSSQKRPMTPYGKTVLTEYK